MYAVTGRSKAGVIASWSSPATKTNHECEPKNRMPTVSTCNAPHLDCVGATLLRFLEAQMDESLLCVMTIVGGTFCTATDLGAVALFESKRVSASDMLAKGLARRDSAIRKIWYGTMVGLATENKLYCVPVPSHCSVGTVHPRPEPPVGLAGPDGRLPVAAFRCFAARSRCPGSLSL